ncbi:hypothetical protein GCM10023163_05580 [Aestuariibaculum suncheonense]
MFFLGSSLTTKLLSQNIQRVRIDFTVPGKLTRPLLFSFTKDNSATDNYDYGYDAINYTQYPYDLNWVINDLNCTIQAVGAYDDSKKYPLWLFMSTEEDFFISFNRLENFDTPIDVFIYDKKENTYTRINDSNFKSHVTKGEHDDRFYLAFKSENTISSTSAAKTLSTEDEILKNTKIQYLRNSKELYIDTNGLTSIKEIALTNVNGQRLFSTRNINDTHIKVPIHQMGSQLVFVNVITDIGQTTKQLIIH